MERGLLCYFESEEVIFKRYVKQSVPRSDALLSISSGLVGNGNAVGSLAGGSVAGGRSSSSLPL